MSHLNFNGKIIANNEPLLLATNRSYRYGDGLFETMKVFQGEIMLFPFHFDRLFSSLSVLQYEIPTLFNQDKLQQEIIGLCAKNKCTAAGRVRLSIFRGNGGLNDGDKNLQYIIECWSLPKTLLQLNENGLVIDIYPDAKKSIDKFSNIKSANFLSYSMAALFAKENKLNDCLVLNANGNIADSSIANVFLIKSGVIRTPSLDQGCVNGVMRRYLLEKLSEYGYKVNEGVISIEDIYNADEVFLSNAIYGIRWVRQCGNKEYSNTRTFEFYHQFIQPFHT